MNGVSYTTIRTPPDYKCSVCDTSGCKLWRQYQTFFPRLFCAPCAGENQKNADTRYINEDGYRLIWDHSWPTVTCTIDWLVPAVPDEEGVGYWGYSSVPTDGYWWWQDLPTYPEKRNT